ncbi:hypothetical protein E2P71_05970 [Candidatus Bathyarchaeota archaeon]|nr:hypothetical protein E2P71_05970 [Candidatus Bathyarchaeota archaeon]
MVEVERQRHRITRIIAATRFPFVDQPEDSWPPCYKTIVNDEEHRFGLLAPWGEVVYPSIVILNCGGGVQELGMVEAAENVNPERAKLWQFLSDSASVGRKFKKLFVYVPHGLEPKALDIIEGNNIEYDGLRGYGVEDGWMKIYPIKTHDSPHDHR